MGRSSRRSYLSVVTGKTSPHISSGVGYDKSKSIKPWKATTTQYGRNKHIGYFATEEEAHQAYEKFMMENCGNQDQSQEVSDRGRRAVHCISPVPASFRSEQRLLVSVSWN